MKMSKATGGIGKALHDLNVLLFEKNKKVMYVVAIIVIPALTYFVFNMEAKDKADEMLGSDDIRYIIEQFSGDGGGGLDFGATEDFEQMREIINQEDMVNEKTNSDFPITANSEKVIEQITVTVTWEDEQNPPNPRVRRYRNQPDEFSATVVWPGKTNTSFIGEGSDGRISNTVSLTEVEMEDMYGQGDFILIVTCIDAGDWEPLASPLNLFTLPDTGNDVSVQIEIVYWAPPLSEE